MASAKKRTVSKKVAQRPKRRTASKNIELSDSKMQKLLDDAERIFSGRDDFHEAKAMQYFLNFMKNTERGSPSAYGFMEGMEEAYKTLIESNEDVKKFPVKAKKQKDSERDEVFYVHKSRPPKDFIPKEDWEAVDTFLKANYSNTSDSDPDVADENLERLMEQMELSELEREVMRMILVADRYGSLTQVLNESSRGKTSLLPICIARMLDRPADYKEISAALQEGGKLAKIGFVTSNFGYLPEMKEEFDEKLDIPNIEIKELMDTLAGKQVATDLKLEDFSYIGEDLDYILEIIDDAVKSKTKGVNVLLYGPAGGGKTELAKAIAQHLEYKIYAVGEEHEKTKPHIDSKENDWGDTTTTIKEKSKATTSEQRLAKLTRTHAILEGRDNAIAFFDEVEDLLMKGADSGDKPDTENKVMTNRLFEDNPVVTIWAGNNPEKFHESMKQRFTHSLYVDLPPVLVRKKIWETQIALQKPAFELPERDILNLARKYSAAPRQIAKAIQGAKAAYPKRDPVEAINLSLPASSKLTDDSRKAIFNFEAVPEWYDQAHLNVAAGQDLDSTKQELVATAKSHKPFILYAHGPDGAGMKPYIRSIAEDAMMNTLELSLRGFDPNNLAKVFNYVAETRQFLILNDFDALAPAKPGEDSSWTTSGLLKLFQYCAEQHDLPFAVTSTNTKVKLPDIVTDEFSHEIEFKEMCGEHKARAYRDFFERDTVPSSLAELKGAVVEDFVNAKKRLRFKDIETVSDEDIAARIKKESGKREERTRTMGFDAVLKQG